MKYAKINAFREVPKLKKWANDLSLLKAKEFGERFGRYIGKGSGRIVYKKDNYVIKRALNSGGIEQNEKQMDIWNIGFDNSRRLLAPVFALSENSKILIMRYVEPFRRFNKSIKEKIGISIKKVKDRRTVSEVEVLSGEKWEFLGNWEWGPNNLATVYLEEGGIGFRGDFVRPSSWGKIGNRIVLLDYGF